MRFSTIWFKLAVLVLALVTVVACSPEITFTPTPEEEPEEVVDPNEKQDDEGNENKEEKDDENKENEETGNEEEDKDNENGDENEEKEKGEEKGEENDEDNPDCGNTDEGNTEVENPVANYDITPWTGAWASDAGKDSVGSDADFYHEANSP